MYMRIVGVDFYLTRFLQGCLLWDFCASLSSFSSACAGNRVCEVILCFTMKGCSGCSSHEWKSNKAQHILQLLLN
jgi:hypothetical protein